MICLSYIDAQCQFTSELKEIYHQSVTNSIIRVFHFPQDVGLRKQTWFAFSGILYLVCSCSVAHCFLFFVITWNVSLEAPLSMEFYRQEYWSGLPFPTPGDLSEPRTELMSLVSLALAGRCFTIVLPGKLILLIYLLRHKSQFFVSTQVLST